MPTYCGNNLNHQKLVSGTHVLGTNYECMRKGIGFGSHLPYDASYAGAYAPVDPRKFYCGNNPVPPAAGGYLAVGSPSKCLQIGIGVGKAQRTGLGPPAFMYFIRYVLPYVLFSVIIMGIFAILYFVKPKFVTKKDKEKVVIDWNKFIPYFITACLSVAIIIYWFWKKFVRRWI
jgi:hypothetical protein